MATEWKRIEELAGERIDYVDPPLFLDDEVWFYRQGGRLAVALDGALVPAATPSAGPVSARRTLYDVLRELIVDIEVRGGRLVVRRGVLNGAMHLGEARAVDVDALVRRYAARGFTEATPWGFPPFGSLSRQLHDGATWATVRVDGADLHLSGGRRWYDEACVEHHRRDDEAIAAAERRLADLEAAGFTLRNLELLDPPSVDSQTLDKIVAFVGAEDPHDAVDRAVEALRQLARDYPRGHLLVEELDLRSDGARLAELGLGDFFVDMHEHRIGRWRDLPGPERVGSSYAYFLARYATLTWIIAPALDHQLPTFLCGNVSGGGWSPLEIGEGLADASPLADERPGHGYEDALVFHGGWGRTGYLFDRRQASPTGEWAIYPICLDGPQDEDPPADDELDDPASIEPFGFWFEREVYALVEVIRPRLAAIQPRVSTP